MTCWYVLRTRTEDKAREALADIGFYGHVPMERVQRRLGRKVRPVERPVWRGYVFVLCGASDLDLILAKTGAPDFVRWPVECGPGLSAMVPITLRLSDLDPILKAEAEGELDYAAKATYSPQLGDSVLVRSGKWKGFLGRIVALSKRKLTLEGESGYSGKLQVEPEHLSQPPEEQHLAA